MNVIFKFFLFISFPYIATHPSDNNFSESLKCINFVYKDNEIEIDSKIISGKNRLAVIKDANNNIFIIKQPKGKQTDQRMGVIREMLGAHMAQQINIVANHVQIIPADIPFLGKFFPDEAATIHTFVPGKQISKLRQYPFPSIENIHSIFVPALLQRTYFYKLIFNTCLNTELFRLSALDTFIGNSDRGTYNLFYDEYTQSFYAIDFEASFQKNLSLFTSQKITQLIESSDIVLHPAIFYGLTIYKNTLEQLIDMFPPQQLNDLCDEYIKLTTLATEATENPEKINKQIMQHKNHICESYQSSQELVLLLDILLTSTMIQNQN